MCRLSVHLTRASDLTTWGPHPSTDRYISRATPRTSLLGFDGHIYRVDQNEILYDRLACSTSHERAASLLSLDEECDE